MINGPHRQAFPGTIGCDVAIIGSGAGGATIADQLTAAGLDVVMLEAGPYLDAERVPQRVPDALMRMWRCGGLTAGLGHTPVSYAEGRCVGGGTEINSAIMQRPADALLDEWARNYRIDEFGGEALRPYYDRAAAQVGAKLHGGDPGAPSDILRRAGEKQGWKTVALERAQQSCVGTNSCATGCPTGAKQSMSNTAIPRALARGMRLLAETQVSRLIIRGDRVVEVRAISRDHDGRHHAISVRPQSVFVCGGAVHTPAILRRSGIRNRIGETLRMHPTVKVTCRFDRPLDAHLSRLPLYAIAEFMPDQRIGGSIFQPGFLGMSLAEDWAHRGWMLEEWRHVGMYYAMARGEGTGSVRPLPGCAEPLVRYAPTGGDMANLGQGLARLGQAMFAAGATHVYPSIDNHPGWTDPSQCGEFEKDGLPPKRSNLMSIHLFSSCPPGEDNRLCGTDSFGRVRGLANVIVADASSIPESPGCNPQLSVMALALRAADAFLAGTDKARARTALAE